MVVLSIRILIPPNIHEISNESILCTETFDNGVIEFDFL